MTFKDWQDTADAGQLVLPIRGRDYVIPELGYLDGIKLRELTEQVREGGPGAATMSNEEYYRLLLGGSLDRMREDNVPASAITKAAAVAHQDAINGRQAAQNLWNEGPDPEALAAALKKLAAASTTSPSTPPRARTSSTRKRASTANTRSRTKKAL